MKYQTSTFVRALFARDTLRIQKLFIGNLSHELRTPLSIIKAEGEIALMGRLSSPARKSMLAVVREADRINTIIDNILTLENLLSPHMLRHEHVDLTPILHRVLKRHRTLAREGHPARD